MRRPFQLITSRLAIVLLALLAAVSASATGVLYDNSTSAGSNDYNVNGWTLNFGNSVANSFVLPDGGTLTNINFDVWAYPDDVLSSINWYILADDGTAGDPLSGTVLASGVANPVATLIETNLSDFLIYNESFATPNIVLLAGVTYWLELDTAVVPSGNPIYWGQSDAQSMQFSTTAGTFPGPPEFPCAAGCTGSEGFQLLGDVAVPEPGSFVSLGAGLVCVAIAVRRRRKA